MSNVKGVYTNAGVVIGDVTEIENLDGSKSYEFSKPVQIQPTERSVVLTQVLGMFVEDKLVLKETDFIFGQLFTPVPEIVEYYISQMNPSEIITPSNKIIV